MTRLWVWAAATGASTSGRSRDTGAGEGQAAKRVVHQVQLALASGHVGGGGVQQFRVGADLGRGGGALFGQVLEGVLRGGRVLR